MTAATLPPHPTTSRRRPRANGLLRSVLRQRAATISAAFLLLLLFLACTASFLTPYDPDAQLVRDRLQGPSAAHLLGTDDYGRDVLSRLLVGARVSLWASLQAVGTALVIGLPLGVLAGYVGGWLNASLSRVMDALMSTPGLVLAISIVAVLGPGITKAMLAVGIVMSPRVFRVARAATVDVRAETYVEAAVSVGVHPVRIVVRNILPNVLSPIILVTSVSLGSAVAAEASLSFLGLGVRPPAASWGSMLSTAASNMSLAPHLVWPPGIMIFVTVLAFTYLGDGIRRATLKDRASVVGS
jgi:peptide/nickel transport system permease protein